MSHDDKVDTELSTWRNEWQALGGTSELAAQLVARAARDGKRMRRAGSMEVLAATFSSALCLFFMVDTRGSLEVAAMTGVVLLFNGAWLAQYFTLRRDLFRASGEGVEAFISLTRRRLATELRWTTAARRWTLALGIAFVPWSVWVFAAHMDAYLAHPWRGLVGFGGAAAIFVGVYLSVGRRRRKLRVEEEAFERQVADGQLA